MQGSSEFPRLLPAALLPASACLWIAGCGAPAAPQPPTLNLPQPVAALSAARSGNTVGISFVVPQKTTDRLPVRGEITAKLCRSEAGPCQPAASKVVKPLEQVSMDDVLPAGLQVGPPRLLAYHVTLENSGSKSAAPSPEGFSVAGQSPEPVASFTATQRRDGIVLHWQPLVSKQGTDAGDATVVRFDRLRTAGPPPTAHANPGIVPGGSETPAGEDEPAQQTLELPETPAGGQALDATARTGRVYRYTAQRLARYTLGGHAVEMASMPSAPVLVDYRDVFPPPAPTGLLSAVDSRGRSIDLTWIPDQDPHLGGYIVYRRALGGNNEGSPSQRLTPAGHPLTVTVFSDTNAVTGQRYAYSVSAVDSAGNEGPRSAEVEETLPPPDTQP